MPSTQGTIDDGDEAPLHGPFEGTSSSACPHHTRSSWSQRYRFSKKQIYILKKSFAENPILEKGKKFTLAKELGLKRVDAGKVEKWYVSIT